MPRDQKRYKEWKAQYMSDPEVIEMVKKRAREYYQREDVKQKRKNASYKRSQTLWIGNKREEDPGQRFIDSLRNRQKQVLKGMTSTTKGLGCTKQELRLYIESQFVEGMSFGNYGNKVNCWSIDHILPLSSYEKDKNGSWDVNSEYNKKLIHYTNLRPMWHIDNIKKSNTLLAQ